MNLNEYDTSNQYSAMLLRSDRITPAASEAEVRHLVLQLPVKRFDYLEGQSIGVLVPGPHDFGSRRHLRLYSIANSRSGEGGRGSTISICVRRCFYIDEVSGERYPGKASNFLCDAQPGDPIQITGPYGSQFSIPADESANLLMVGVGTGIAPFRAFVKRIFETRRHWTGKIRLFHGATNGMELLYMNDVNKDLALYYDEDTFRAFEALSPRPHFNEPPALDRVMADNASEIWDMVQNTKTHIYLAGLLSAAEKFDKGMIAAAGSEQAWRERRSELVAQNRYAELLYE